MLVTQLEKEADCSYDLGVRAYHADLDRERSSLGQVLLLLTKSLVTFYVQCRCSVLMLMGGGVV